MIVQYDFRGQIVFQHRCQDKWRFGGNRRVESLCNEDLCFDFVAELARQWSGVLWQNDVPSEADNRTAALLAGRRYLYRRVHHDERIIKLDVERVISDGAEECERRWHINHVEGQPVLTISRLDRPTCHLRCDHEGTWRGAWLEQERMPIELIPLVKWTPVIDPIPEPQHDKLIITVAVGELFHQLLKLTGPIFEAYARRVGADFIALTDSTQQWWGLEKFRVLPFAQRYQRTLYLDADIILRHMVPDLFELVPAGHVAMHDDYPHLPSHDWLWNERRAVLQSQHRSMDHTPTAWNTGLVLCDREQADIWQPPVEEFLPTHCAEQFWLEHSARSHPFFNIPTELNTQYWMPRYAELLPAARVVHLANCPNDQRLQRAREITVADQA